MVAGQNNSSGVCVDDSSSEFSENHRDLVGCGGEREDDWVRVWGREGGDNEQVTGRVASEGEGQADCVTSVRWCDFLYGNHCSWN